MSADGVRLRWTTPEQLDPGMRAALLGPGAPFELVTDDVLGVPTPVFATRPRSIGAMVESGANHGDRPYLIGPDRTVTFGELPELCGRYVAALTALGVVPGDRVVLRDHWSVELAVAALATACAGAIAVVVNPRWTATEHGHAVATVEPRVALDRAGLDALDASARGRPAAPFAEVGEDDPFAIIFTSGTTGRPKGAVLTHRNAGHFALSNAATTVVHRYATGAEPYSSGRPACVIGASPMFHISGLLGQVVNTVAWGTSVVVPPPGRWDETVHLELTQAHGVTMWSLVPTQLWRLVDHPELHRYDLSSLESAGGGGANFEPELLRRTAERIPHLELGCRVGYGMTECTGTFTLLLPPYGPEAVGSVGTVVAGVELEVRGPDGRALPEGEVGEIHGNGAGVFAGYWGDPAASAAALDEERWYATGDYGRIEGDLLFLESRLRDMIIRGGENVYPIEIENRLVEHPAVLEAAVVGVDHPTLGQEVKAVVVAREGMAIDAGDVRAFCAEVLTSYKVPAYIEVVAELPRTDTGKVLKSAL